MNATRPYYDKSRGSPLSHLSVMQYMGLSIWSLPSSLSIMRIYVLPLIIIIKWQICIIVNHCLELGNKTMVCAVCLAMLLSTSVHVMAGCREAPIYYLGQC